MKYLGIDYGTKRIGLAISGSEGILAHPYKTIKNNKNLTSIIGEIVKKESIESMVIGESLDEKGGYNQLEKEINDFRGKFEHNFQS